MADGKGAGENPHFNLRLIQGSKAKVTDACKSVNKLCNIFLSEKAVLSGEFDKAVESLIHSTNNSNHTMRKFFHTIQERGIANTLDTTVTKELARRRLAKKCLEKEVVSSKMQRSLLRKRHNFFPLLVTMPGLGNATPSWKRPRLGLEYKSTKEFARTVDAQLSGTVLESVLNRTCSALPGLRVALSQPTDLHKFDSKCSSAVHWPARASTSAQPPDPTDSGHSALVRLCAHGSNRLEMCADFYELFCMVMVVRLPFARDSEGSDPEPVSGAQPVVDSVTILSTKEAKEGCAGRTSAHLVFEFLGLVAKQAAAVFEQESTALGMSAWPGWALEQLLLWGGTYKTLFTKPCLRCHSVLAMDPTWYTLVPPVVRPLHEDAAEHDRVVRGSRAADVRAAYHLHCFNSMPTNKLINYEHPSSSS